MASPEQLAATPLRRLLALIGGEAETPEEKDDAWNEVERRLEAAEEALRLVPDPEAVPQWRCPDWRELARQVRERAALAAEVRS